MAPSKSGPLAIAFSVWGFVRNLVYAQEVFDLGRLRGKIIIRVAELTPEVRQRQ